MTPREAELWRRILDARLLEVHTALVCRVETFDAAAQTVDCKPMVKAIVRTRDGQELEESYPLLRSVPVAFLRGGGYFAACPLVAGDFVTVIFHEWSIDRFRDTGGEVHPVDVGRHSFAGAWAIPAGPYPTSAPIGETLDGLVVGKDGGTLLRIGADGVAKIAAAADAPAALAKAQATEDRLAALETFAWGHAHLVSTTGTAAAQTGTAAPQVGPSTLNVPPAPVATTKVQSL